MVLDYKKMVLENARLHQVIEKLKSELSSNQRTVVAPIAPPAIRSYTNS